VAQHLAQRGVLVGQLLDPVVIGIQPQPQGNPTPGSSTAAYRDASVGTGEAVAAARSGRTSARLAKTRSRTRARCRGAESPQ